VTYAGEGLLQYAGRDVGRPEEYEKAARRAEDGEGFDGFDRVSISEGAPSRHPRASAGSVLGDTTTTMMWMTCSCPSHTIKTSTKCCVTTADTTKSLCLKSLRRNENHRTT
jgi:hypothetical protein